MPKNKKIQVLSGCSNVTARFLKFFGTSILNVGTIGRFFMSAESMDNELLLLFIACGTLASIAGTVEALNIICSHSKKMAKAYKVLLKSERFMDFIMLFRILYNASYSLSGQQYIAIPISAGITLPFALWRAYKSKRYWIENPITLFLAKNLKDVELGVFPLPRQVSSHQFSLQSFSAFKRLRVAENVENDPQKDRELLREYFNAQIKQHHFFNRYVLMDSLAYGAEIAGIVGYVMFTIDALTGESNPMLNLGIGAILFIAGILVGYRIEKIKDLLLDIYTGDFTRDEGLQDSIHELLVDLYAHVTANVRRFAKVAEFVKNMVASFIGLQFVYEALTNGDSNVPDSYTGAATLLSILVGINSIYNVERQQQEMLKETGAHELLEERRLSKQGQLTSAVKAEEVDEETAARGTLPIAVTPKKEDLISSDDQRTVKKGSPDGSLESSNDSSASDSPPESRSLPVNTLIPIAPVATRAQSVANEEIRATKSHHKQGWGEWFKHTFFSNSSSTQRRELAQELLSPADRTDESQPVGATAGV